MRRAGTSSVPEEECLYCQVKLSFKLLAVPVSLFSGGIWVHGYYVGGVIPLRSITSFACDTRKIVRSRRLVAAVSCCWIGRCLLLGLTFHPRFRNFAIAGGAPGSNNRRPVKGARPPGRPAENRLWPAENDYIRGHCDQFSRSDDCEYLFSLHESSRSTLSGFSLVCTPTDPYPFHCLSFPQIHSTLSRQRSRRRITCLPGTISNAAKAARNCSRGMD